MLVHHRLAHLQGRLQQRLRPSREHDLQLAVGAVRLRLHLEVPTSITYRLVPRTVKVNVNRDLGLFAQDKWTTGRWTLSGGVRYDSYKNSFPQQSIVGTFFGRSLNISYDTIDNLSWHDVTPKLGATYDVFGNGKTAFKVTLNKYLEGLGTTGARRSSDAPNPINRLLATTNRTWSDTTGLDVNGDFVPQCDLNNFAANGECGAWSTPRSSARSRRARPTTRR